MDRTTTKAPMTATAAASPSGSRIPAVMLMLSNRGLGGAMRAVVLITIAAVSVRGVFFITAYPHMDFTGNPP